MAAPALSCPIELFVSAKALPQKDVGSASDPFVVLLVGGPGAWVRVDQSEVVMDNPNPAFTKQFLLDYRFEEVQHVKLEFWDFDQFSSHDYLGEVETTLGRIMGSRGSTQTLPITARGAALPRRSGHAEGPTATVTAGEVRGGSDQLRVQFRAANLDKKDWFGSSDPFVSIARMQRDSTRIKVWQSDVIKNNLNPTWKPVDIPIQVLCNGDLAAPLVATVTDWDKDGSHDLIGETSITVNEILAAASAARQFPLVDPKKIGKRGYSSSGFLMVNSASIARVPSFLEYIAGGCQLQFVAAIDYTGSNGDPRSPSSLHFFNPVAPNEYLQATTACSEVLLEYDADKNVPVFGFGGSIRGGPVNHCFALNFNEANPEVPGLAGIVSTYQNSFNYVSLSGPTYFAPIIRRAAEIASVGVSQAVQRYTVLLLITDGQCNDLDATIDAIIDASRLPMSIVIVGVGGADFSAMEFLDSDEKKLAAGGKVAARDCCQFVPFRKFAACGAGAGSLLAKEVLKEVPAQLTQFFISKGIVPNPRPVVAAPILAPAAGVAGITAGVAGAHIAQPPPGVAAVAGAGAGHATF